MKITIKDEKTNKKQVIKDSARVVKSIATAQKYLREKLPDVSYGDSLKFKIDDEKVTVVELRNAMESYIEDSEHKKKKDKKKDKKKHKKNKDKDKKHKKKKKDKCEKLVIREGKAVLHLHKYKGD